jgi:hypothetical protein
MGLYSHKSKFFSVLISERASPCRYEGGVYGLQDGGQPEGCSYAGGAAIIESALGAVGFWAAARTPQLPVPLMRF